MQALEELDYLAALDNDGNLSEMGIIMSEFPLGPQMAKTLLASCEFDCVSEVVIIAAMLTGNMYCPATEAQQLYHTCTYSHRVSDQVQQISVLNIIHFGIFLAPTCFIVPSVDLRPEATQCHMKFQHPEGDHFTLINIYKAFKQCQRDPCELKASQRQPKTSLALNNHIK